MHRLLNCRPIPPRDLRTATAKRDAMRSLDAHIVKRWRSSAGCVPGGAERSANRLFVLHAARENHPGAIEVGAMTPRESSGALGGARTLNLSLRRAALYPLSYKRTVPPPGFDEALRLGET